MNILGPVKELPVVSDYDDDDENNENEDDNWSISSFENTDTEAMDDQILNMSPNEAGSVKKSPRFSSDLFNKNKQAVHLIFTLVKEFTHHNTLPLKRNEKKLHRAYNYRLTLEFISVFSQVVDKCCDDIYEEVVKTVELKKSVKSCKKVKTKNVSCQTCSMHVNNTSDASYERQDTVRPVMEDNGDNFVSTLLFEIVKKILLIIFEFPPDNFIDFLIIIVTILGFITNICVINQTLKVCIIIVLFVLVSFLVLKQKDKEMRRPRPEL